MDRVTFDYSGSLDFIDEREIIAMQEKVNLCHKMLHEGTGEGSEFSGWVDLPNTTHGDCPLVHLKSAAEKIRGNCDIFIILGIGGSYLGARAAIEMLNHNFYNELPKEKRNGPKIYFAGHNVSSTYLKELLDIIGDQDICINVISKSGTTTETAIAFRIFRRYMEERYGKSEAARRIYATTDKSSGALKKLADKEGYETFVVPDDIGGRYSVLTPVGLLPMAVAGVDIAEVMQGAKMAADHLSDDNINNNPAYQYAAVRNILYSMGKTTEVIVNYEPNLFYFGEWFKQLFGESEGKDGKGIFPASLNFTTDLHSMGQYMQDGKRNIFETILNIEKPKEEILISRDEDDLDGLNYISGKTLDFVNKSAMKGTIAAHIDGGVPNLVINIPEISPYYFGYLVYFFEKACGMSGYLLGVNPFNQPGVEAYKKNMLQLLGK
ncbi:MAG: glucose-6-phosphate isomerase [Natronincolaceae bacterium]|jgi:glucose-6-phosphate isomerase|nr:glucose-6-phosphate isomerase [Bacillota bacterium]NLK90865.1 glucose-6-phosphate isomerase [Clostridiales bacterium]